MIKITKVWIYVVMAFALLAIGLMLFLARPAVVAGVDGGTLAYSIAQGSYGKACVQGPDDKWSCEKDGDGPPARYEVDVDRSGCWRGSRLSGRVSAFTPEKISGCISIFDVIQLENIFG